MLNAKKLLTKAAATVTCVAMLAGNGLSAFAGTVTIDTTEKVYFPMGEYFGVEENGRTIMWDDDNAAIFGDKESLEEVGLDEDSVVVIEGNVYIVKDYEYDKESGKAEYVFVYAGKYDDWFGESEVDDYITRLGKKIREIYMAQVNKSLKYNNHVEYREGDGIRYDMMEALSNTKGVVLDFYFTYKGEHYHATITSEKAQAVYKKEIEVYGPQFILANFPCEVMNYDTK